MKCKRGFDLQFFGEEGAENGDGGKHSDQPEKTFTQADVDRLVKDRLERERRKYADYDDLKKIDAVMKESGMSLEDIRELRQRQEDLAKSKEQEALKKGDAEKIIAQMNEKHGREVSELKSQLEQKDKFVRDYVIESAATAAIANMKGVAKLLLPHVKAALSVETDDGKIHVRVLGNGGEPRVNSKGEYMTAEEYVAELRNDDIFSRAFEGEGTSGSGVPASKAPGRYGQRDWQSMSAQQRVEAARAAGLKAN